MVEHINIKMNIENKGLLFLSKKVSKKIDENSYLTDFCTNEDDAYYLFLDLFLNLK